MIILKKHSTLIFTIFQIFLFISSLKCEIRSISIIILSYFYYSTFTGWHECVHRDFSRKKISFEKIIGVLNIAPLLVLNYKSKLRQHIDHHSYTNDPDKDPDYFVNNFIFKKKLKKYNFSFTNIDIIESFFKILFLLVVYKYWILNFRFLDYLIAYFVGNIFVHLVVNIMPHYKTSSNYGRDFKFIRIFNFLLLGNNLHGTHHKFPTKSWWSII